MTRFLSKTSLSGPITISQLLRDSTGWAKKPDQFLKCLTLVGLYDDVGRRSIYQNVELFIRSKSNIRNVAIFKYSWQKFGETILPGKY